MQINRTRVLCRKKCRRSDKNSVERVQRDVLKILNNFVAKEQWTKKFGLKFRWGAKVKSRIN